MKSMLMALYALFLSMAPAMAQERNLNFSPAAQPIVVAQGGCMSCFAKCSKCGAGNAAGIARCQQTCNRQGHPSVVATCGVRQLC